MIKVDNLTMVYKSGKGVFDINLDIKEGSVFGYLGPNGAGKTTTIRNLLGFTNCQKGTCTINGYNCRESAHEIHKVLGYIAGEIAFFDDMNGAEFLDFVASMRKLNDKTRRKQLLDRFNLDPKQKIRYMSKGMKQKLAIVTAFMHDPAIYILDEPTSGLDPLMQAEFINLVVEEKKRGKTVLLSSHIFEEVDRTCDDVAIIKEGRIIAYKGIKDLKKEQRKIFSVILKDNADINKLIKAGFTDTRVMPDNSVNVTVTSKYNDFFKVLSGCDVVDLTVLNQSLEQIFMQYYQADVLGD